MASSGTASGADGREWDHDERRAALVALTQGMALSLGRKARAIRLAQNRVQEEVAERTLIARNSLQIVERGLGSNPRLSTLVALADTLGVSVAELVSPSPRDSPDADAT